MTRKPLTILAVLAVGTALAAPPLAAARRCGRPCRDEIVECRSGCIGIGLRRRQLAQCKRRCRRNVKIACRDTAGAACASPSGAFIDASE